AEASAITAAAPPTARLPRCTMCHSFGTPSWAEYWHIGETMMRLRKTRSRWVSGSNKRDMRVPHRWRPYRVVWGGHGSWNTDETDRCRYCVHPACELLRRGAERQVGLAGRQCDAHRVRVRRTARRGTGCAGAAAH